MSYRVLACDYDGTIASDGKVDEATELALAGWRQSGRGLVLVTGRQLPDLLAIFPRAESLFDWIVAENGPVLYRPLTKEKRLLAATPSAALLEQLRLQHVVPLFTGDVVIATTRANASAVLAAIQGCGLQLEMIFNKASLMVLPTGVSKATGLTAALRQMAMEPGEVAGIGDAENDVALIGLCGLGVAVANAVPELKQQADRVTTAAAGAGVAELIADLLTAQPISPAPP